MVLHLPTPFALMPLTSILQIPTSILRSSRVIMNEPPRGLKATLLLGLKSLTPKQVSSGPAEKQRRQFLSRLSTLSMFTDLCLVASTQYTSSHAFCMPSSRSD